MAPREPDILRILQKKAEKLTLAEQRTFASDAGRFLIRVRSALNRYAAKLEAEGQSAKARMYRDASAQIPRQKDHEPQFRFEDFKKLLPSLKVDEDDALGVENVQLLERERLRNEVANFLSKKKLSYSELRDLKVTLVSTTKSRLERDVSTIVENSTGAIWKRLNKSLSSKNSKLNFEIISEVMVSDQDGRILAASSVRSERGRVIPNRRFMNHEAFIGSVCKPILTTGALDTGKVSLETQVCSSDAISVHGYFFANSPADGCATIGQGLQRSYNWSQANLRKLIGNDEALQIWARASNRPVEFPHNFTSWRKIDQDRWHFEQSRGLNADSVSMSTFELVGLYTPMAAEGVRTEPTFIRKIWIGKELIEPPLDRTQVFTSDSVAKVSALLQVNGRNAFGLGTEAPATKTGSSSRSYASVVWTRNAVIVARVIVLAVPEQASDTKLEQIEDALASNETARDLSAIQISTLEMERDAIIKSKHVALRRFEKVLASRSKKIIARDIVQPMSGRIVKLLYKQERGLFSEPGRHSH